MEEKMEKLEGTSLDIKEENIEKLKQLFPNIVTDGKIDFDMLRTVLGNEVDESKERYQFTWNGKSDAIKIAQIPSSSTLRPVKNKSKDWDTTQNLYIEGDNLEVLKQLQKTYHGKIKMIYIDPPYNTGHEFVYRDNYATSIQNYELQTKQGRKSNPETSGRYHTDWLNMIYPRLILARNLLRKDGVVFISIDDNEVDNLKKICAEIFGDNNYVSTFPWRKRTAKSDVPHGISQDYEWVICYAKSEDFNASVEGKERNYYTTDDFPNKPWRFHDLTKQTTAQERPNSFFTIVNPKTGEKYPANPNRTWAITEETFKHYYAIDRIIFPGDYSFLNIKKPVLRYWKEDDMAKAGESFGRIAVSTKLPEEIGMSQDGTKELSELFNKKIFSFPKPVSLLQYLISICELKDGDIVLDFFSGSATTAQALLELNAKDTIRRQCILVQLPEVTEENSDAYIEGFKTICDIGEERIRRAGEKIKKEWEEKNKSEGMFAEEKEFPVDIGFKVFKLDSSNIEAWDNERELNNEGLLQYSNQVFKEGRSKEDVLYEIMLKYGIFDREVSEININGKTMYQVGKRYMIVCLEDNLTEEDIRSISERKPNTVVFKESGFKDDNAKINAVYNLEKAGVKDVKCI